MEGQMPVRSIHRGYQASAQSFLAAGLSIDVKWNDAESHLPDLILRSASMGL